MWVSYLDFMRQQWPNIDEVEDVEKRYASFNNLAPPYKSAFSDWLNIKKVGAEEIGPYKRQKINH